MPRLAILPVSKLPLGRRWLTVGVCGHDVRQLQMLLTELGLYDGAINGEYDLLTREAVKSFQKAYHLPADGVCGPDTLKLLAESGIHNRILITSGEGETIQTLAVQHGVGGQAFKDPVTRCRLRRIVPGQQIMVERRELIWGFATDGLPGASGGEMPGEASFIYVKPDRLLALAAGCFPPAGSSLVVDLSGKKLSRREGKALRRVRRTVKTELIWWQNLDHCRLPTSTEADALIVSVPVSISDAEALAVWPRQIKKLLTYYPCTRLFLHFDLHGKGLDDKGREYCLTPVEKRLARLNRIGEPKRIGRYGWLSYRYRYKDETKTVFIPDRLTIRGILDQIDRLNLRGVVFTGLENGWKTWQEEGNRYFSATPRMMVMNNGGLA
ncbi:MAG TPA: peptidoglycan-binding protein [Firmicutes bacterium]|uniref:Peptidoglycan-binding protein n=1 Tax=Capillibacterium thermochitinicola TaxID=2699427 RepID=A0A8J6I130_9FIRM|nr:peptidoglycan-binding protein [Capillibacterium thermochitinicola]MBA2133710.1 peptidoglycan-binding protein [Capillibacterium thermochitinicola]HHW11874.1 peptidoglycan-binding protein [Bacillota bacterium]